MELKLTRTVTLPDKIKLARLERVPELGPKVLFFSGGTALRSVCPELIKYTHNSIHIITPFDSGGSSAVLRKAFNMPAIGDVRNRLLALADQSLHGHHEIYRLFAHRFTGDAEKKELMQEINAMVRGEHRLVAEIPDPMRKIIRHHLHLFKDFMPGEFNLKKASIGNLILTAGYLENRRNFDVIIYIFSKLVQVRGIVRPVINKDFHIAAELEDGTLKVGQHMMTGKECPPLKSRIKNIWICPGIDDPEPVDIKIRNKIRDLIMGADLICYPIGSFYSSLIANLLPTGVGAAIAAARIPKIYIPNTGSFDPEASGLTLMEQVYTLLHYLTTNQSKTLSKDNALPGEDENESPSPCEVLNYILIDGKNGNYEGELDITALNQMGIEVIDMPLITRESSPYIDPKALVSVLLSLS